MEVNQIIERLGSFPDHDISYYDRQKELVRKTILPSVQRSNGLSNNYVAGASEAGMYMGILATTW